MAMVAMVIHHIRSWTMVNGRGRREKEWLARHPSKNLYIAAMVESRGREKETHMQY